MILLRAVSSVIWAIASVVAVVLAVWYRYRPSGEHRLLQRVHLELTGVSQLRESVVIELVKVNEGLQDGRNGDATRQLAFQLGLNVIQGVSQKFDDQARVLAGQLNVSSRTEAAADRLVEGLTTAVREEGEATRRAIQEDH